MSVAEGIIMLYPELRAGIDFTLNTAGDILTWESANKKPTKVDITRGISAYNALQYQRDRKIAYPSMATQLDYIYHNGITKWKTDMIDPIKLKYPKPV